MIKQNIYKWKPSDKLTVDFYVENDILYSYVDNKTYF